MAERKLNPDETSVVHEIATVLGDVSREQQLRVLGAVSLLHGHYDEAFRFLAMAGNEAMQRGGKADG